MNYGRSTETTEGLVQQHVYVSCGGRLPMSGTFLNFVPVSGTKTRFESRSRHKHRSLVARRLKERRHNKKMTTFQLF